MKFVIALTFGVLIAFVAAAPAAEGECKDMCGTRSNYNGNEISCQLIESQYPTIAQLNL